MYQLCSFATFGNFEVNKNCQFWQFLECFIANRDAKYWWNSDPSSLYKNWQECAVIYWILPTFVTEHTVAIVGNNVQHLCALVATYLMQQIVTVFGHLLEQKNIGRDGKKN